MIEIIDRTDDSLLEISAIGTLTKTDVEEIGDFFENKLKDDAKVNMLLLMDDWDGLTPSGLLEDFKLAKYVKNMNKVAIVADSEFLKADSKVENLFPGVQVKYFSANDRLQAEQWLNA